MVHHIVVQGEEGLIWGSILLSMIRENWNADPIGCAGELYVGGDGAQVVVGKLGRDQGSGLFGSQGT
jgi:hypothetical protein